MTARNSVRRRASSYPHDRRHDLRQPGRERPPAGGRGEDEPQQVVTPQPRGFDRNAPLAHDLLLQAARQLRIAPGDIGVREQPRDVGVVESAIRTLRPAAGLQLHEALDEGVGQTGTQRIAHRDVDRPDLGRHGAEQRQQQVLVRQHHGGLLAQPAAGRQPAEDRRHVLALHGVRHGGHRGQLLGPRHAVVREFGTGREAHDVFAHEHSGLLLRIVLIIGVVVPVEIGFRGRGEKAEQLLLALGEGVESRHDEAPGRREGELAAAQTVGGGALHHAAVGDTQLRKPLAEAAIDRSQRPPYRQKAPLLLRKVGLGAERRPEGNDPQLRGGEVGNVGLDLPDLLDIAEKHRGVDPVFVDRVEIGEKHVAPEVEFVERFGVVLRIDSVQLRDEPQAVARPEARYFGHQLVDRGPRRLPHRPPGDPREGVGEEQPCTARRKEHGALRQLLAVARIEIRRDFAQETLHRPSAAVYSAAPMRAMLPPMNFSLTRSTAGSPL